MNLLWASAWQNKFTLYKSLIVFKIAITTNCTATLCMMCTDGKQKFKFREFLGDSVYSANGPWHLYIGYLPNPIIRDGKVVSMQALVADILFFFF